MHPGANFWSLSMLGGAVFFPPIVFRFPNTTISLGILHSLTTESFSPISIRPESAEGHLLFASC